MAEKQRSPNFPGFGLTEAILKAKQLYDHDGKAAVPREVAVQAWGYKGLNGASLRVLGALRQFGLLDTPTPGTVRVSSDALVLILEPENSHEWKGAMSAVAMRPTVFRALAKQYPDGLPSDGAIVSHLVRTANFSEDAARVAIAAYRDTLALAKAAGSGSTSDQETIDYSSSNGGVDTPRDEPLRRVKQMPDIGLQQSQPYDLTLALMGGVQATVRIPRQMSEQNYNLLVSLIHANLTAMKPALVAVPDVADTKTQE